MDYLFTTYGTIGPEVLRERKLKVSEMAYDLLDPLVAFYDEIEELGNLSVTMVNPYSQ